MVEWKKLGEVCEVLRGKRLTKNLLDANAPYPVYHGGLESLGRYSQYNREANTVMVINVGASAGNVGFCDCKFWSSDGCFCISHSELLNNKYLFYFLQTKTHFLQSQVRHAGIPTLDSLVIEKIKLPMLPLSVQSHIVSILDTFTSSIANLKQQIEERRKQYEYERDRLLDLEGKEGVEMKKLGEVCNVFTGGEVPDDTIKGQIEPTDDYPFAVYTNGKETYGFSKKYQIEDDAVCISSIGANTGTVFYKKGKFTPAIRLKVLIAKESLITRFLFYAAGKIDFRGKNTGSVPNINANYVKSRCVFVPPLPDQQCIVSILDTFEASIRNLERQLALREKQYEYYRNQLLTFD